MSKQLLTPIDKAFLARNGVVFDGAPDMFFIDKSLLHDYHSAMMAMDAQPSLNTSANAGIPAYLTTVVAPEVIDILFAPMSMVDIVGERQYGDWTTTSMVFPVVEATGEVATYGDFSNNGMAGTNATFPERQPYLYQVFTKFGDKEADMAGNAKLSWANELNKASLMTLNRLQNRSYAYGIAGLKNWGLLNDPNLTAPFPASTLWSAAADSLDVYETIRELFAALVQQTKGIVRLDTKSQLTLALSPTAQVALTKENQFNVNVMKLLQTNFPNMTIKTAPEYETDAGELVQLIAENVDGTETMTGAYPMKLRTWALERRHSHVEQKKAQGTYGVVVKRPVFIVQMLVS